MADRVRRLSRGLAPRLRQAGGMVGAAARLMRQDLMLFRLWARHVGPVRDALGEAEARAYTELVLAVAGHGTPPARRLATQLPDQLARVEPGQRGRYLSLLRAVLSDRPEALLLVVRTLPPLLQQLDDDGLSHYLARGLELHRQSARHAESFLLQESGEAHREAAELERGLALSSVHRTLTLYARAHCGQDVQIKVAAGSGFTDGRHIYLPERVDRFDDERDFLVFRVMTARNAGYLEFGTLDLDLAKLPGEWPARRAGELELDRLFRAFPNHVLARDLFSILENLRVESQVRREYPGIARDMDGLAHDWRPERPDLAGLAPVEQAIEWLACRAMGLPLPVLPSARAQTIVETLAPLLSELKTPQATIEQTVGLLRRYYTDVDVLMRHVDDEDGEAPQGGPDQRGSSGRSGTRPEGEMGEPRRQPGDPSDDLSYRPLRRDPLGGELRTDALSASDRAVEERAHQLLESMQGSAGAEATLAEARRRARREQASYAEMAAMLDRMNAPAGPARSVEEGQRRGETVASSPSAVLDQEVEKRVGSFVYPEWDCEIGDHKPAWVRVDEVVLKAGDLGFVEQVQLEHGALIASIRRAFEALRPNQSRWVRAQPDGDEIDIDRAIAERIEHRAGGSPDGRIYSRHLPVERDVAVAFLVDMSSSTNELVNAAGKRIIDVEKQALVLIAEAVDALGDSCAIWGFSGYGREQVAFYVAKEFTDAWDDRVRERIGRISWKMENRDGAAIRHATHKLLAWPARIRLLLLLSDGKPLDCGCENYSDKYAHEDVRMALSEARSAGIHAFCITVDPHGQDYLPKIYGRTGYTVISRVESLPRRLPQVYRRLTR